MVEPQPAAALVEALCGGGHVSECLLRGRASLSLGQSGCFPIIPFQFEMSTDLFGEIVRGPFSSPEHSATPPGFGSTEGWVGIRPLVSLCSGRMSTHVGCLHS